MRASDPSGKRVREKLGESAAAGVPAPEWHGVNLADASPEDLEKVLSETVPGEFKLRLGRVGIEYQTPIRP